MLPNITMEDKGLYQCRAEVFHIMKNATAKVVVYGEIAFNNVLFQMILENFSM